MSQTVQAGKIFMQKHDQGNVCWGEGTWDMHETAATPVLPMCPDSCMSWCEGEECPGVLASVGCPGALPCCRL